MHSNPGFRTWLAVCLLCSFQALLVNTFCNEAYQKNSMLLTEVQKGANRTLHLVLSEMRRNVLMSLFFAVYELWSTKFLIRWYTCLSVSVCLYMGQSALGHILQNWLTNVSIISWAEYGRRILVGQTFVRCLWGAPFSNKGPIRTRPYFVFVSWIGRPIHDNKIWPSAYWPYVWVRACVRACHVACLPVGLSIYLCQWNHSMTGGQLNKLTLPRCKNVSRECCERQPHHVLCFFQAPEKMATSL